jgi:hypothetical protein
MSQENAYYISEERKTYKISEAFHDVPGTTRVSTLGEEILKSNEVSLEHGNLGMPAHQTPPSTSCGYLPREIFLKVHYQCSRCDSVFMMKWKEA